MKTKKKQKLKLKPSARDKRRYFTTNKKIPHKKIEEAILHYIGTLGLAQATYKPIQTKNNNKTTGSCNTKSLELVRAALTLQGIKIDKVSGTIKGLEK
jgi:RNase P/RNase MRP subunit POP5